MMLMKKSNQSARYDRHKLIDWFSQEDLESSHIAVVGTGAVGNEVLKNLALLGVGKIDIFDFDNIEIHNLTRTVLFTESDIGRSKVDAAKEKIKLINPNIDVNAFAGDAWELIGFDQLKSYNSVICCADNFEIRIQLNKLCYISKIDLVNLAIDSKFVSIETFPFSKGDNSPCYECTLPSGVYNKISQRYSCGWLKKISFIEKKIPTTIITSSIAGSLGVSKALKFENKKDLIEKDFERIFLDSFTGSSTVSKIFKKEMCIGCSLDNEFLEIFSSKSQIGNELIKSSRDFDMDLYLSDPLIFGGKCTNKECDHKIDDVCILKKASKFDDSISKCNNCNSNSVDIEIKDRTTLEELLTNFSGYSLDCKFLYFANEEKTTIIEMR